MKTAKVRLFLFGMVLICLIAQLAFGQVKPIFRETVQPPADKRKFWLFLLAGQSNMAGRGIVEAIDTMPNVKVLTLNKNGEWEVAKDPIHFDKPVAGVGPGLSFGKAMSKLHPTVYIGLIPCAVGGSSVKSWQPNGTSYRPDNYPPALARCRKAMESGTLKGIIWHQGESESSEKGVTIYEDLLTKTINGFRKDLELPNLPFVAGELPAFQIQRPDSTGNVRINPHVVQINAIFADLKNKISNYDYVKADSTDHRGDHLHFNAASARLMGERYAVSMEQLLKQHK